MVKIDLFCGLLGSGKTTLIKRMLSAFYSGYRVAIIENEFGKVNLDAAELASASIQVKQLSAGCICCTVKGDLANAVGMLIRQEKLDYIIIEASGVADLRALLQVCADVEGVVTNRVITVVNGRKILKLMKVIGNFFMDQIRVSTTIYLNFCEELTRQEVTDAENALLEINPALNFVSIPLSEINAGTFPDQGEENSAAPVIPVHKAFGRLVSRRTGNVRRSASSKNLNVESWDYTFTQRFTKKQLQQLMELLRDDSHHTVWRAKGYLEMEDGSIRKVDYTFGDSFEASRQTIPEDSKNLLVVIGPALDVDWLDAQFHALFGETKDKKTINC